MDAQRDRIEAWCLASEADLVEVVVDAGVSGTVPLVERAGGARVAGLLDARRPDFDVVVVARLDRLGRTAAETLGYLRRFSSGSVSLVAVADRLDLSTPQGRAMAGVSAVFGELERDLLSARTQEALAALRAQSRVYSPVPYGFLADDGHLVPEPDEQRVLKGMRVQRTKGASYARIADGLNRRGVAARRGGPWFASSVRSVLITSARIGVEGTVVA